MQQLFYSYITKREYPLRWTEYYILRGDHGPSLSKVQYMDTRPLKGIPPLQKLDHALEWTSA